MAPTNLSGPAGSRYSTGRAALSVTAESAWKLPQRIRTQDPGARSRRLTEELDMTQELAASLLVSGSPGTGKGRITFGKRSQTRSQCIGAARRRASHTGSVRSTDF